MSPVAALFLLGVVLLCVLAWRGGLSPPGRSGLGPACRRRHRKAVEEAQDKAIEAAVDDATAKILGPVPSYPAAPETAPPNG